MAKYAFLVGCLDTTDIFSKEMEAHLLSLGHKCIEIDVTNLNKSIKVIKAEHIKERFDGVIAFNNLGYSIVFEGENIWDSLGIIYIDILMDHPFNFHDKLINLPENTLLYCIDRNHVGYIKRYYDNIRNVSFLPHGGCFYSSRSVPDVLDRDIDIIYPGSLSKSLVENLIPDFSAFKEFDGTEFSKDALSMLINSPDITTEDCLRWLLESHNKTYSLEEERRIISAFRFLDGFAVSYFREISIRILVENGFKVTVLGDGWEDCEWIDNQNLRILKRVSPYDVLALMKRSKIVINTMTWFKEGVHDRIFNGYLCKAAVLTDTSGYLEEIFSEDEGRACFHLSDIWGLPYLADELLNNDSYRESVVDKGYAITVKEHTWGHRMEKIMRDCGV